MDWKLIKDYMMAKKENIDFALGIVILANATLFTYTGEITSALFCVIIVSFIHVLRTKGES